MNKECLKKNMLLKKENKETVAKGIAVNAGKNDILANEMVETDTIGNEAFGNTMEVNADTVQILRVLAVENNNVLVIDCIKKTMPVWMEAGQLDGFEEVKNNGDGLSTQDKLQQQDLDALEGYSPDVRKIIYQRYNIISAILPFVADEAMRSEMVARMAEEHSISKQSVRKYLCEYLVAQDIRSLAPQEKNTERALTQDEKNMRKALNKYFYTTKKRTLKNVYTMMLRDSYCDKEGKLISKYPSFYQFRYFFRKYNNKQTEYISRNGLSFYQRNQRPLVGDGVQAFAPNVGVGMLDATVLDIYLINEAGGIVGRPILTACVDAYSGLCCGYSLSWEGGVYSLRNLMVNVITDKVEHCKAFGIEINREDWNCNRLPGKFVTDMGSEYKGAVFEQITELGVQIINLPSYRPELKSKVEKFFDIIQGYYRNQLKGRGVVEPDFQERGVHDYRKDACLTMDDFEKIIIHCIIFYNSRRVLENFPYTEEMLAMGIKPYASEIWNYGCGQEGCSLINVGREQLILTLLLRAAGKFTRHGLSVNGMHYHNKLYREQYLNGKACVVAYNPDNVCQVWLVENGTYIPFDLVESRFRDGEKNLADVQSMKQKQRELVRQELGSRTQAEIDLAGHISAIAGASVGQANTSVKNIRDNRKKEQGKSHKDFGKEMLANG